MTTKTAERITGLTVQESGGLVFFRELGTRYSIMVGISRSLALSRLVQWNYERVSDQVRVEQSYRCWSCSRILPLEIDHIVPRSKGRDDRRANLRALDSDCHRKRHSGISIEPSQREIARMASLGFQFTGDDQSPWKERES